MDCLKNFIGIRQACVGGPTVAPKSGQYIEDYAGLTRASLQAIEPGVWNNCQTFLDDMVRQAAIQVVDVDARAAIEPYLRVRDDMDAGLIGVFGDTAAVEADAKRGLRVKKTTGILGKIVVGRVWVKSTAGGTFTVTITDGTKTTTEDVVVVADVAAALWPHFDTFEDTVDITITDAAFVPYGGDTSSTAEYANCTSCSTGGKWQTLSGRALHADTETDKLQGITAEVSIGCDLSNAICLIAKPLRVPIFFATVMKVLENWEATPRMNFFAHHQKEWAEKTYANLVNKQYPTAWDLHSKGLARYLEQLDPVCVDCGSGNAGGYGFF